jgi:MazG family protein
MARLRDPVDGCPWDQQQDFASIAPYTIEEAYEVADAIERGDMDDLEDELGDLLFQVVYHAQMARERGAFGFDEVTRRICEKMVRRHPHVFGDATVSDAESQSRAWEALKREERARQPAQGVLAGLPAGLPALTRAVKLGKRAGRVGFDWPGPLEVGGKVREELQELDGAIAAADAGKITEEAGDLLFAVANLCRHLGVDPEAALRRSNHKFERRFGFVERELEAAGERPETAGMERLEALWNESKRRGV